MNKAFIFITGFFAIAILSGCVSARNEQNPQPKAELLCKEWDKTNSISVKQANLTPRMVAEQFLDACAVGDYEAMPSLPYYALKYCQYLSNATIKEIIESQYVENFWTVRVYCPEVSTEIEFYLKKKVYTNAPPEWQLDFPLDIDKKINASKNKSASTVNAN